MTKRSAVTTVALSVLAVMTAGCMIPSPDNGEDFDEPFPTEQSESPDPDPSSTGESLEGQFEHETMNLYVDEVLPWVVQWVEDTWPWMPVPDVVYVEEGDSGPEACLDGDGERAYYSSESYEYCPTDETVYLGQDTLWLFYSETGDAGPAMGIAHEFGHHIQYQVGVPGPQTAEQSIEFENQADCLAGAWIKYTDEVLHILEYPDDIEDIDLLMPMIASAEDEGSDRDHGTLDERIDAFTDGYEAGVEACGIDEG